MSTKAKTLFRSVAVFIMVLTTSFVCNAKSKTNNEKRAEIRSAKTTILNKLYKEYPETRSKIANSVGYGAFDNKNMNLLLLSTGNGTGVVKNNRTGKETFMAMGSLGGGIGIGAKDMSVVFIFNDTETMNRFITEGWQFGGQADATAVDAEGDGGSLKADGTIDTGAELMEVYTITDAGVAIQATVSGTKYWQLKKLNK